MVLPNAEAGRARWPRQRGAHCGVLANERGERRRGLYRNETNAGGVTEANHLAFFFAVEEVVVVLH